MALAISTSAFAQLDWGVKGGLNVSGIRDTDYDAKPSIYVGGFVEAPFNYFMNFKVELVYSRQGGYDKYNGVKTWRRLNYLNIPVIAQINLIGNLSLETGPQFGFMLNGKDKIKYDGHTSKHSIDSDDRKTFDFSWAMGLNYKLTQRIDIAARYNLGLTKVMKHTGNKPKNSVFQIGAGYHF